MSKITFGFGAVLTRVLVGGVLVGAAYLKGVQWVAERSISGRGMAERFGTPVLVAVEFLLGVWLLSGWRWSVCRRISLLWMAVLGGAAFYKVAAGEKTCGCFGAIAVRPWVTLALDGAALAALLLAPVAKGAVGGWRRWGMAGCQIALVSLMAGVVHQVVHPVPAGMVEMKLEEWRRGATWALGPDVDVWEQISHGKWVVIVYGSQCRMCVAVREEYETLAEQWRAAKSPVHVALIDTMADMADPSDFPTTASKPPALYGALHQPAESNTYVPTPLLVMLVDGHVVETAQGYDEVQWGERAFPK